MKPTNVSNRPVNTTNFSDDVQEERNKSPKSLQSAVNASEQNPESSSRSKYHGLKCIPEAPYEYLPLSILGPLMPDVSSANIVSTLGDAVEQKDIKLLYTVFNLFCSYMGWSTLSVLSEVSSFFETMQCEGSGLASWIFVPSSKILRFAVEKLLSVVYNHEVIESREVDATEYRAFYSNATEFLGWILILIYVLAFNSSNDDIISVRQIWDSESGEENGDIEDESISNTNSGK